MVDWFPSAPSAAAGPSKPPPKRFRAVDNTSSAGNAHTAVGSSPVKPLDDTFSMRSACNEGCHVTPGGCQIVYMEHTGCHQLNCVLGTAK
jgi:hypothetical protein